MSPSSLWPYPPSIVPGIQKVLDQYLLEWTNRWMKDKWVKPSSKFPTSREFYSPLWWLWTASGFLSSATQFVWPPSWSLLRTPDHLAHLLPFPSRGVCARDGHIPLSGLFPWQLAPSLCHTHPASHYQALLYLFQMSNRGSSRRVYILSWYRMSYIKGTLSSQKINFKNCI